MSETRTWSIDVLAEGIQITNFTLTTSETNNKVEIYQGNFRVQATIKNTGATACVTAGLLDYQGNPVNGSWILPVPVATNASTTYDRTFHYNNGSSAGDLPVGSLIPTSNRLYIFQVRISTACYAASAVCLPSYPQCDPFTAIPIWIRFDGQSFTINVHGVIGTLPTFTPHGESPAVQPGTIVKVAEIVVKNNGNDQGVVNYMLYQNPGEAGETLLPGGGGVTLTSGSSSQLIPLNATAPSTGPWKLGLKVHGQSEPIPEWGTLGTYIWEQGKLDNNLIIGVVILAGLTGGIYLLSRFLPKKH